VTEGALRERVESVLGRRVSSFTRTHGGDINDAFELELEGGERVFLKTNQDAPPGLFTAEARGLELIRTASALRVPKVLAAFDEDVSFLLLEFIHSAKPARHFDEELGRGLAALHRAELPYFGLDHDNFIATLRQSNRRHESWAEFYRAERLEPQLRLALGSGRAPRSLARPFERLFASLAERVGPAEPPARLHGDLWGGNLHIDEAGAPVLIDPALYGGHREIDLAMMQLFGGFSARVFAAYAEAFPLAPEHAERVTLYQLYPLLVHVNLFGGSYVARVRDIVEGLA